MKLTEHTVTERLARPVDALAMLRLEDFQVLGEMALQLCADNQHEVWGCRKWGAGAVGASPPRPTSLSLGNRKFVVRYTTARASESHLRS